MDSQDARYQLQQAVDRNDIPGAVALIGNADEDLASFAVGVREYGGELTNLETYYDLASLTKVLVTTAGILKLISQGELALSDTVSKFISNAGWFQTPSLADVSILQLLTHSSGLAAWKPLFAWCSTRQTALANALQSPIENPAGEFIYSDLGFIVLGAIIERISKQRLDLFSQEQIFAPLGISGLRFGPINDSPVAASEDCAWRNTMLRGVVHDENAFCLGQVAGHAGLFGQIQSVAKLARAWLHADHRLLDPDLIRLATQEHLAQPGVRRGLGWLLAEGPGFYGIQATTTGFGHTGFTGTSLWIEPEQHWFAVLLTNRVHPSRQKESGIHQLRQDFHNKVAKELA